MTRKSVLYIAMIVSFAVCAYLLNLGVYTEWGASFPERPPQMRTWAYVYYGLSAVFLVCGIVLFRKARRHKDKQSESD